MNVVILHSAVPPEAPADEQDGLLQSQTVAAALHRLGYTPVAVPLSLDLAAVAQTIRQCQPVCVFNLVETICGQGQGISLGPMLLDALGVPYTGADTTAMFVTSNKLVAKQCLRAAGLPTPPWASLLELRRHGVRFPGPYIVKSVWEHGSIGLEDDAILMTADALEVTVTQRQQTYGGLWFVERYIAGREINIALLAREPGAEILPPAEIQFVDYPPDKLRLVGYRAKWLETSFEYRHTRRCFTFSPDDAAMLADLAGSTQRCWELFELHGYARVDWRIDQEGKPWILEVNANPCLAPDSGFLAAAAQAGYSIDTVMERILKDISHASLWRLPWQDHANSCRQDASVLPKHEGVPGT